MASLSLSKTAAKTSARCHSGINLDMDTSGATFREGHAGECFNPLISEYIYRSLSKITICRLASGLHLGSRSEGILMQTIQLVLSDASFARKLKQLLSDNG